MKDLSGNKNNRPEMKQIIFAIKLCITLLLVIIFINNFLLFPPLFSDEPDYGHQNNEAPTAILFPRKNERVTGNFITARELMTWGSNRGLTMVPDCFTGVLRNHIAVVIPPQGMAVTLASPGNKRAFLYLDVVSFRPSERYNIDSESICNSKRDSIFFNPKRIYPTTRVHWLEITVNGRMLKRVYQGGGVFIVSPIVVPVNRELTHQGKLKIRLLPSPGESFFAIWDIFVSRYREREK